MVANSIILEMVSDSQTHESYRVDASVKYEVAVWNHYYISISMNSIQRMGKTERGKKSIHITRIVYKLRQRNLPFLQNQRMVLLR